MRLLAQINLLARLRLDARRRGVELRLQRLSGELQELIEFCGLAEALGLEAGRKPEEREESLGVEEERELDDPPS